MKRILTTGVALAVVAAFSLTGCSSGTSTETTSAPVTSVAEEIAGFPMGSVIGVALPDKTSENWVRAGDIFTEQLTAAGFEPDVQFAPATNTVAEQQNQINAMVTNGAKVIFIGAKDGSQLSAQVEAARDAGVVVIAYERAILNTEGIDYYVGFDNIEIGKLQGQALLDGLAERIPDKETYNIELFSGSPDDNNAGLFFEGAMSVLQPKIDDGTLVVVSGQTDVTQTATQGWLPANSQARMDTILAANYQDTDLDGVLSPNDTLARSIMESVRAAGKPLPVVTGQDSELESVKSIVAGEQYSTIYKDTRVVVAAAVSMVEALQKGEEPETNTTSNNGARDIPTLSPGAMVVTKENATEAYASDPVLAPATNP